MQDDRPLPEVLGRAAGSGVDRGALLRLARAAASSMRAAGAGAVASGRWLTETAVEMAPHLPVRDLDTLRRHHDGLADAALAGEVIRNAARATAAVGAATGALAGAEELSPPAWIALPIELVLETLAVAAIEMKLVAELHEVFGRPVPGHGTERATALARAWAERRGVTPGTLTSRGGLSDVLGRGTRNEVMRLVRRRLMRRTLRNASSLAPFLIGAVAGAELNRRATASLGDAIVRDLATRPWH
ncbi:MAG: hypothetical protein JWP02_2421 [Acidimicrobiales bacterium]|nr:hypothetical protein [Acidimicrobiales bacterium]